MSVEQSESIINVKTKGKQNREFVYNSSCARKKKNQIRDIKMYLYELYLVQPDLQHDLMIVQTANSFEYLTNVVNEIFDKIDARIETNNAKIRSLNDRTAAVKNKIDSLVGINKAIKIFSPVKYPGASLPDDVLSTFSLADRGKIKMNTNYKIKTIKPEPVTERAIEEKLQFYHVQKPPKSNPMRKSTANTPRPFPCNTKSINNLLLFNEPKIMFGRSSTVSTSKIRKQKFDGKFGERQSTSSTINSIPLPVLNRNLNTKKLNESLFYTPNITKAPELDVPHYLPDLPGIADDIEFTLSNIDDLLILPNQVDVRNLPDVPVTEPDAAVKIPPTNAPESSQPIPTGRTSDFD